MVIWITGLPGAGKTTVANLLHQYFINKNKQTVLLDGDLLRAAFDNVNYDPESRMSLAMTYSRLCQMFSMQGKTVICATVSMFNLVRQWNLDNNEHYLEVYLKVSKQTLFNRGREQVYSKRTTDNTEVIEVSFEYEEPQNPHLIIQNEGELAPQQVAELIIAELEK